MSVTEKDVLLRGKDVTGNSFLVYPITKAENVDGLDEVVSQKTTVQIVTWEEDD